MAGKLFNFKTASFGGTPAFAGNPSVAGRIVGAAAAAAGRTLWDYLQEYFADNAPSPGIAPLPLIPDYRPDPDGYPTPPSNWSYYGNNTNMSSPYNRTQSQRTASSWARTVRRGRRTMIRRSRRRKFRRMRKLRRWLTPSMSVPPVRNVKMHYTNFVNPGDITLTANEVYYIGDTMRIRANSVYHPCLDTNEGGRYDHNASQYNYYSTFYNNYEVKLSKMKLTIYPLASISAGSLPYVVGLLLNRDDSPAMDSFEQLCSRLNVKYKRMHFNPDKKSVSVKMRFNSRKQFNDGFGTNVGTVGNSPTATCYYIPFIQMLDVTNTTFPSSSFVISVTYYVRWFNRREIMDMPHGCTFIQTT